MLEVAIVQEILPHYRIPFFDELRAELRTSNIHLRLLHGRGPEERRLRADEATLDWAEAVEALHIGLPRIGSAVWQSALARTKSSDLVIVEHANRQLVNYPLLARQAWGPPLAFWGHGGNLQAPDRTAWQERFKRQTATLPHWWFAYTQGSAERVAMTGFPRQRITVVANAVDTSAFAVDADKPRYACVYVGSLYEHKRLPYLLEAAREIARVLPDFSLTIVGDGELRAAVEAAARQHPWLHFPGPKFGREAAEAASRATLMLMPGLVGLAAVDSFAAATPLVTIDHDLHSPEYEYVKPGINGIVLPRGAEPSEYAAEVVRILSSPREIAQLQAGCRESAQVHTLGNMVDNFAAGVRAALTCERRPIAPVGARR